MTVELFSNPSAPGTLSALTTLSAAITSTTATTINVAGAALTPLQASGQFRILIDSEIMLVTGGAATTTWTVVRGASAETGSVAATHLLGANVYHILTAQALREFLQSANNLSDLASASTARTNLGLGSAALLSSSGLLLSANNLSDVASAATARTNLGLGSAATSASSAFDAAGISAAETTRAEAAEATLTASITTLTGLVNALPLSPHSPVSGTTYTLVTADIGHLLIFTNAAAITVTVPSGLMSADQMAFAGQGAAGKVSFAGAGGVTVEGSLGLVGTNGQYAVIAALCVASNTYWITGDRA